VFFQRVPEAKVAKNRVHLDIRTEPRSSEAIDAKVAQLVAAGGTELGRHPGDMTDFFVTMADPEGNEFDVT
jgi:predicted enzyme related to lactoylglutathione lyase